MSDELGFKATQYGNRCVGHEGCWHPDGVLWLDIVTDLDSIEAQRHLMMVRARTGSGPPVRRTVHIGEIEQIQEEI